MLIPQQFKFMKRIILLTTLSTLALYGCAQSVNLLATKVAAPAGSLLYVGVNGLLIPLTPPPGTSILSFSNGTYAFVPLPAKGDKGDTGPQGQSGAQGAQGESGATAMLPSANEGDVLAYLNGQWLGTPATFNIDVSDSTATAPITLANKAAVKGGAYWIGGYVNIRSTDNSGTVALQYSYTDQNGDRITRSFPVMQAAGNSQYNPVIIKCKAGTLITISTICSNPNMSVIYDAGDVLHELK